MFTRPLGDFKDLARDVTGEFRGAANDLREMLGLETDKDLRLYKRLSKDDFAQAMSVFGPEKVIGYISSMEAKMLRRRVR